MLKYFNFSCIGVWHAEIIKMLAKEIYFSATSDLNLEFPLYPLNIFHGRHNFDFLYLARFYIFDIRVYRDDKCARDYSHLCEEHLARCAEFGASNFIHE